MNLDKLLNLSLYLKSLRDRLNLRGTELENFFGPVNKDLMANGSGLIPKSWPKRKHITLVKFTSGHNTIMIRTTSLPLQSKETCFNTTIKTTSQKEMESGPLKENV